MTVTLVAAVAANGVIGARGAMPWHLPEDLRHFKAITMGRPMVMGRKTFEAIGRPLPGRRSIVVTRDPQWSGVPGDTTVTVVRSVEAALLEAGDGEVMVVGGGQIYAQTIDLADRLEITHLDLVADGDTRFPRIDPQLWEPVSSQRRDGFTFVSYRRRDRQAAPGAGSTDR